jgi:hypothetical protein
MGYWPQFAFGNTVGDRNTVVKRDLSGLHRPHHGRGHGAPGRPRKLTATAP